MCTRFYIEPETEELSEILEDARKSGLSYRFYQAGYAIRTSGEIRPSDVVPVVAPDRDGNRKVFPMRWGFQLPPPKKPLLVNARVETAAEKPTFREEWRRRRCAVPASWYYEWTHIRRNDGKIVPGDKYLIQPRGASVAWLCGLYRIEDGIPVFTVLTREPSTEVSRIHNRMPLILPAELTGRWISPGTRPEDLLDHALTDMVVEKAE